MAINTRFGAAFLADRRGGVAVMFGLLLLGLSFVAGMAIDYARIVHAKTRLTQAADAAALAAGRALLDGRLTDSDVQEIAERYFRSNMVGGANFGTVTAPAITIARETGEVHINVAVDVPMTLSKIAGYSSVKVPVTASTRFDDRDIELALALDVTGSMQGAGKIGALKTATKDLIDIMLPDQGTKNLVRVALVPFSSGVDAGQYAREVTGKPKVTCTFEREGANPAGDQAPGPGNYLKIRGDAGVSEKADCPDNAEVIALSSDKRKLKQAVDRYEAKGNTAGHLGAMWGSYLLSPHWSGVFGAQSAPVAYDDRKTVKAMVLMSDGQFNTMGGYSGRSRDSQELALEVCKKMRSNSIMIYAVGFKLDEIRNRTERNSAMKTLLDCAGKPDRYFDAANGDELRAAFTRIATQLNNLRLTN